MVRVVCAVGNRKRLGPVQYTVTDLGTLPGGTQSCAYGINNSGQVVGSAETSGGADHAFLYSGGSMQDLGTLGGTNSARQWHQQQRAGRGGVPIPAAVRSRLPLQRRFHARPRHTRRTIQLCLWHQRQRAGRGVCRYQRHTTTHAFLYSGGSMQDLGTLGGTDSEANGINNSGQVVG